MIGGSVVNFRNQTASASNEFQILLFPGKFCQKKTMGRCLRNFKTKVFPNSPPKITKFTATFPPKIQAHFSASI